MAEKIKRARPPSGRRHIRRTRRPNIPTAELESFARPEEKRPAIVRYPRDPTLDPQLVWKGKDEQDAQDLEVPAVPIYIQETIDPLALVEELRAESEGRRTEQQLGFFAPYTDLTFEEKVDFYRHPGKWSNRMILGDSLLVMTSLAEKEGLKGQVQTIYIDPPYGIKFGSNWQVSTRKRDVKRRQRHRPYAPARAGPRVPRHLGARHPLVPGYLRDRLAVARELLTESGSVFVQIGDENVHLVRGLLDEVFGSGELRQAQSISKTAWGSSVGPCLATNLRLSPLVCEGRGASQVPTICSGRKSFEGDARSTGSSTTSNGLESAIEHWIPNGSVMNSRAVFRRSTTYSRRDTRPSCTFEFELDGRQLSSDVSNGIDERIGRNCAP